MNCKEAEPSTSAPTRYIQMGGKIHLSRETMVVGAAVLQFDYAPQNRPGTFPSKKSVRKGKQKSCPYTIITVHS